MKIFLTVSLYITTILMIAAVLMQPHKSDGMSANNQKEVSIFGVSTDGGPLAKATVVLAILIGLIIFGLHYTV